MILISRTVLMEKTVICLKSNMIPKNLKKVVIVLAYLVNIVYNICCRKWVEVGF